MRQTAGSLNRIWLVIVGLVILLIGAATILQSSGTLQKMVNTAQPQSKIASGDVHQFFDQPVVYISMVAVGIILGLLALGWIAAQVPRRNAVSLFRLQEDRSAGTTTINPGTLATAVKDQCEQLPGVVSSSAVIRGTAAHSELTLEVKVSESTDIAELTETLRENVVSSLEMALAVPLASTHVRVDVVNQKHRSTIHVPANGTRTEPIHLR